MRYACSIATSNDAIEASLPGTSAVLLVNRMLEVRRRNVIEQF